MRIKLFPLRDCDCTESERDSWRRDVVELRIATEARCRSPRCSQYHPIAPLSEVTYPRMVRVVDCDGNGVYRNLIDTGYEEDIMNFASGSGFVSKYELCVLGWTVVADEEAPDPATNADDACWEPENTATYYGAL